MVFAMATSANEYLGAPRRKEGRTKLIMQSMLAREGPCPHLPLSCGSGLSPSSKRNDSLAEAEEMEGRSQMLAREVPETRPKRYIKGAFNSN